MANLICTRDRLVGGFDKERGKALDKSERAYGVGFQDLPQSREGSVKKGAKGINACLVC